MQWYLIMSAFAEDLARFCDDPAPQTKQKVLLTEAAKAAIADACASLSGASWDAAKLDALWTVVVGYAAPDAALQDLKAGVAATVVPLPDAPSAKLRLILSMMLLSPYFLLAT